MMTARKLVRTMMVLVVVAVAMVMSMEVTATMTTVMMAVEFMKGGDDEGCSSCYYERW